MDIEAKIKELQAGARKEKRVVGQIVKKLKKAPLQSTRPCFIGMSIVGVDFTAPPDADNARVLAPAVAMLARSIVSKGAKVKKVWRGIYDGRYAIDVAIAA